MAGIAAGQQEQSHDGRNSHKLDGNKNSHKLDGSKNSYIQIVEMSSCISACDEHPHDSRSNHLVARIAAW